MTEQTDPIEYLLYLSFSLTLSITMSACVIMSLYAKLFRNKDYFVSVELGDQSNGVFLKYTGYQDNSGFKKMLKELMRQMREFKKVDESTDAVRFSKESNIDKAVVSTPMSSSIDPLEEMNTVSDNHSTKSLESNAKEQKKLFPEYSAPPIKQDDNSTTPTIDNSKKKMDPEEEGANTLNVPKINNGKPTASLNLLDEDLKIESPIELSVEKPKEGTKKDKKRKTSKKSLVTPNLKTSLIESSNDMMNEVGPIVSSSLSKKKGKKNKNKSDP